MSIFKRRSKEEPIEAAEIVEHEETSIIERIEVPDIKQYLVDEYERQSLMERDILRLKKKLKEAEEVKLKYDAALVTLDEYRNRIQNHDAKVMQLESEIEDISATLKKERDLTNTLRIKLQRMDATSVIEATKAECIKAVLVLKGTLSKVRVKEAIANSLIKAVDGDIRTLDPLDEATRRVAHALYSCGIAADDTPYMDSAIEEKKELGCEIG